MKFKNGPSNICERQPLKNLKWYGLLSLMLPELRTLCYCVKFISEKEHFILFGFVKVSNREGGTGR